MEKEPTFKTMEEALEELDKSKQAKNRAIKDVAQTKAIKYSLDVDKVSKEEKALERSLGIEGEIENLGQTKIMGRKAKIAKSPDEIKKPEPDDVKKSYI